MKERLLMLFTCFFLSMELACAQKSTVTGIVVSAENGEPVVGATVLVKGSTLGTITDMNGKFSIRNVPDPAKTLLVSFIGMENKEVPIRKYIKVTLKSKTEVLGEVLVTGIYGSAKKLGSMVGSVATIQAKKIANRPIANFADALQGQVAGLQVFTSSGEPSEGVSMRLRGVGSIDSSSEPLFILDGAPISGGAFSAINPNDIESLTVLKDASATSIYGSRAANGVVVITTKRGRGAKPTVTIKGQYGISERAVQHVDLMNSGQYFNFCETVNPAYKTNEAFQANKAFALKHGISTDWYDYFFKNNAPTWQMDASISGVAKNTNYFISASHYDAVGIEPASGMKRETVRSNIDTKVSDWFRIGVNTGLSYEDFETNGFSGTGNSPYNVATLSKWAVPYETPYEVIENGDGSISYGKRKDFLDKIGQWNPYYLLENQPKKENEVRLYGNAFQEITPVKGLTIRAVQAMDAFDYRYRYTSLPAKYNHDKGSASESFQRYSSFTLSNTAEYKFSINEVHNISALAGQESIIYNGSSFAASVDNITDRRLPMLSNGTTPKQPSASKREKVMNSYFSHLEYNFAEKYFFDASFRTDGSSVFGRNHRWASFFSVGGMWNLSKEPFLENISWLKDLKLKLSYGTTGNSAFDDDPYYPSLGLVSSGKYNGEQSFYISSAQNDNLTWEKQKTVNIGLSAHLFKRLGIDLAYYDKKTTDMLMAIPYSYTTGHAAGWGNIGSMFNRGFEATVSYDIINLRDLQWRLSGNVNYNKNRITKLFGGRNEYVIPNTGIKYQVGIPYGEIYYVRWVGVDPADGQQVWLDKNGKETKTFSENNAVFTGKQRYAPWAGGFSSSFSWKGFSINADFSFVLGKYTINNDAFFYNNPDFAGQLNQSTEMLDMWTAAGQVTSIPAANSEIRFDSHLIENASFLRLKNLSIAYSLPERWINKTGFVKGARIFAVGRNLLTATKYTGADPEVDTNLQMGNYPNTKQFTIGAELTF